MNAPVQLPVCFDPPSNGSDTGRAAAESMKPHAGRLMTLVYNAIKAQPRCSDELEQDLGLRHATCSARLNQLHRLGLVRDSGERRRTSSGRKAIVWQCNESTTNHQG